jgi:hypothetical protein
MPQENIWYSDKIYHLQRSLFDIAHHSDSKPNEPVPLDSVCALAALIYCGRYLRDIPFSYAVTKNAVSRLKDAIEGYDLEHAWDFDEGKEGTENREVQKKKLFWILAFGGIAAEGKREHGWFLDRFGLACVEMNIKNWEESQKVLAEVLWQEELDESGYRFWEDSRNSAGQIDRWVEM